MAEMRNLMPNPWPTNANGWTTDRKDSAIELRMTQSGDAMTLTSRWEVAA